jgi:hypothetical protein
MLHVGVLFHLRRPKGAELTHRKLNYSLRCCAGSPRAQHVPGHDLSVPKTATATGVLGSQYTFFFIQCIFLFLSILLVRHTVTCWKAADPAVKKRHYRAIAAIVMFLLLLAVLMTFFVFAGKTTS